jgi:hypothetical protein
MLKMFDADELNEFALVFEVSNDRLNIYDSFYAIC